MPLHVLEKLLKKNTNYVKNVYELFFFNFILATETMN